ncbi:universal stress protein [Methylobacterium durans]|uniref:Universal stress protein n=1 Tax=Methylobacterium durans TaxID=2202825 RepID=A0A2U8W0Z0_9HYPH|nr:universal stress protein [Methylobacterium durans]AWN39707.1 universal stress protein [Methylobacterium durans]
MTLASVMVPLDPGPYTISRLNLAQSLAKRFKARLLGIAAREALTMQLYGRGAYINERVAITATDSLVEEMVQVETEFRRATSDFGRAHWRSAHADPFTFLVSQASSADLIVVNRYHEESLHDWCCRIDPGELILHLGRPVLVAPPFVNEIALQRIVIAWKDTREARRAVRDGLPFLKEAEEVIIATVGGEAGSDGQHQLNEYLAEHGITRIRQVRPAPRGGSLPKS